jgi:hypothetical protein
MQAVENQISSTADNVASNASLRPLTDVLAAAAQKRKAEVIRFRTCCADPRASK